MKAALILLPKITEPINKQAYYDACLQLIKNEGFIPINPLSYPDHLDVVRRDYVLQVNECLDAIFIFNDFAPDLPIYKFMLLKDITSKIRFKAFPEGYAKYLRSELDIILDEAIERGCKYYKQEITFNHLCSKMRNGPVAQTRQFYFMRAREKTKASLNQIGFKVNKDHATVLHGIKKINTKVGVLKEYHDFWGDATGKESIIDPSTEQSIIADLEMRRPPITNDFKSPFLKIEPHSTIFSGFKEHSI